jgi:lysozyme
MTAPAPAPAQAPKATKQAPRRASFAAAIVLTLGVAEIKPWEGLRLEPYFDIVGVATVCFGQTGPAARAGRSYTRPECEAMLSDEVRVFAKGLDRCISPNARMYPLQQAVILSWAYNVGLGAACGSTLVRMLNAGMPMDQWCAQLKRWNRAGGDVVWGLTRRRNHEYTLCMDAPNA